MKAWFREHAAPYAVVAAIVALLAFLMWYGKVHMGAM